MNELAVARAIVAGELPSPQQLAPDLWLCALRITGTGLAYRGGDLDEHVWRDPSIYLTPEFLDRCAGLPVTIGHPAKMTLDATEFGERAVGAICLPYVRNDDEVWGIARLSVDADTMQTIAGASTSPSVVMRKGTETDLDDGSVLNIEGEPLIVDHVAVVPVGPDGSGGGVWDKGGAAGRGIDGGSSAVEPDDKKPTGEGDPIAKLCAVISNMSEKLDAFMAARSDGERAKRKDGSPADREGKPVQTASDASDDDESMLSASDKQNELAEAQGRCDTAAQAWGLRAPMPLAGEGIRNYRLRALKLFQKHSPDFKAVDLRTITDKSLLDAAERRIYTDAVTASYDNSSQPVGTLREIRRRDQSGREIIEFVGDVAATLAPFRLPSMRVKRINTRPNETTGVNFF